MWDLPSNPFIVYLGIKRIRKLNIGSLFIMLYNLIYIWKWKFDLKNTYKFDFGTVPRRRTTGKLESSFLKWDKNVNFIIYYKINDK